MLNGSVAPGRTPKGGFAPVLVPSRYNFWAAISPGRNLLFNGLTAALYELDDVERDLARALLEGACPDGADHDGGMVATLREGGFLIPASFDEVDSLVEANRAECEGHTSLDLMVVPTYECNFRCTYCYIEFTRGRMTADVEHAVVRFIKRQMLSCTALNLTWFGGEPLLCADTVIRVSDLVSRATADTVVQTRCMIATNGLLLTPRTAARLCDAGAPYFHITVDGPPSHHDVLRPTANGAATQSRIMANIVAVLGSVPAARLTMRMNATRHNVDALPTVLEQIPPALRPRVQVAVMLVRGGEPPDSWLRERVHQVMRAAIEAGYPGNNAPFPVGRSTHCDADKRRNFQIGPDGSLYKCTPSPSKPDVRVGSLNVDGTPRFNDRYTEWHAAPIIRPECRECRFLCFCNGGCRIERMGPAAGLSCQDEFANVDGLILNRYFST